MIRILAILCFFVTVASGQPLTLNDPAFFTPKRIYGPIGATTLVISTNSTTTPTTTGSYTPTSDALVLAIIGCQQSVTVNSLSGNGMTWQLVASESNATSNYRTEIWRASSNAPIAGTLTVTFSGNPSARGAMIVVQEFQNVYSDGSNGRNAIVQTIYNNLSPGTITGAAPNPNSKNAVVGVGGSSSAGGILQSGWTQDFLGAIVPSSAQYMLVAHRLATTDSTFTNSMGSAGVTFNFFLELRSANSDPYSLPPNTISNLVVWTRSDSLAYQDTNATIPCVTNNAPVALWRNMGNTAFTNDLRQTTNSYQPKFQTAGANGYSKISFNSNRLDMVMTSFSQPYTLAVIGTYTNFTDTAASWIWANGSQIQLATASTATNYFYIYAGSGVYTSAGLVGTNGVPGMMIGGYNNGASNNRIWGNTVFTETSFSIGNTAINTGFNVGGYSAGGYFLIGDEYEVMFFSRALTTAEVSEIQRYAKFRYGMVY